MHPSLPSSAHEVSLRSGFLARTQTIDDALLVRHEDTASRRAIGANTFFCSLGTQNTACKKSLLHRAPTGHKIDHVRRQFIVERNPVENVDLS